MVPGMGIYFSWFDFFVKIYELSARSLSYLFLFFLPYAISSLSNLLIYFFLGYLTIDRALLLSVSPWASVLYEICLLSLLGNPLESSLS